METANHTVLITGGASGIGLAFAKRFSESGSTVIVCGRREQKLAEAKEQLPGLITRVCDITQESERNALFEWVTTNYPDVDVLVNNAGIQQRYHVLKADAVNDWAYYQNELTANINAPMHLALLFVPYFHKKQAGTVINITSGLAFTPMAIAPIYSATKAAMHSFTVSLRHQLADTDIRVIEVAPPAVNTDLGGEGLHTFGTPVDEFADAVFARMTAGEVEIGYARSENARKMSRDEIDQAVAGMYENMKGTME